jgi:hypothetical protein
MDLGAFQTIVDFIFVNNETMYGFSKMINQLSKVDAVNHQ